MLCILHLIRLAKFIVFVKSIIVFAKGRGSVRLPPGGSWRRRRLKENACTNVERSFYGECFSQIPRAPSTAVAVPLPLGGRLFGDTDTVVDWYEICAIFNSCEITERFYSYVEEDY